MGEGGTARRGLHPAAWWRSAPGGRETDLGIAEFVILSALMLFWEICLIRWISTEIRVFAYYKNLSLLGAFLGFGIGMLTVHRQQHWLRDLLVRLVALIALVVVYPVSPLRIDVAPSFFEEFTWTRQLEGSWVTLKFYGVIALIFLLNAAVFVPWGRRIGLYFERLKPIPAYSLNIASNLLGIGLFSLVSVLGSPPLVWVVVGLAPLLLVSRAPLRQRPLLVALPLVAIVVSGAQFALQRADTHWSPYYKITVVPPGSSAFHTLRVNHDYHQRLLDLRPEFVAETSATFRQWEEAYGLPYRIGTPNRVLVIGAGTGNDVAAALRYGATSVEAVEIDPTILAIGASLHPERPYDSGQVRTHVSDARTYLANPPTDEPFDIVVFGLLDSHTQVSGMTSLRLDNFVYTVESFQQARALLDPRHGLLAVSFSAGWGDAPWTVRRIHRMLTEVFGSPPRTAFTGYDSGISFLAGPGVDGHPFFQGERYREMHGIAAELLEPKLTAAEVPATDDWPFLYLARQSIPLEYWIMIGMITGLSVVWVRRTTRPAKSGPFSFHFFFLGAAFLLIEVRNLVGFSLLFGSTWQVNNLAIGGVLAMILAANLVASQVRQLNVHALYAALVAVLILGFFVDAQSLQALGPVGARIAAPVVLSAPIFCAGLVFIHSFRETAFPAGAMGANILGAICGGLLENASMALGIHALQWLALCAYLLSYLALRWSSSRVQVLEPAL